MSVQTPAADDVEAQIITNDVTQNARYSFKTTTENKTKHATISLTYNDYQEIKEYVASNDCWRSDSQFFVDALVFYLNGDSISQVPAEEVIETVTWTGEAQTGFEITPTLYEEIEMMVNHSHTPWNTKQEFYICALQDYNAAGFPAVTQR